MLTPIVTRCFKLTAAALALLTIVACTEAGADRQAPNAPSSSLLSDNPLPQNVSFANYRNAALTIDPSSVAINSDPLFLKLSRADGEILFLGQIAHFRPLTLTVDHLLDDETLFYEFFDENNRQAGEISL